MRDKIYFNRERQGDAKSPAYKRETPTKIFEFLIGKKIKILRVVYFGPSKYLKTHKIPIIGGYYFLFPALLRRMICFILKGLAFYRSKTGTVLLL